MELSGFYVLNLPEAEGRPRIVHRFKRVLDSEVEKVRPGMALSEARALAEHAAFLAWDEEDHRIAQARWLDACADHAARVEPIDQHRALVDLSDHPQPAVVAERMIEAVEKVSGCSARIGAGSARWSAQAVCRVAPGVRERPAGMDLLGRLPLEWLIGAEPEILKRLRFLGCRTIGDVADLSYEVLRDQFEADGLELWRCARGGGDASVRPDWPRDALTVSLNLPGGCTDRLSLEEAFLRLARRASKRLEQQDRVGRELDLFLEFEEGDFLRCRRNYVKPFHGTALIGACLKKLLPETVERPIVRLRLRMPALEHAPRIQRTLEGQVSRGERERSAVGALNQVRHVFGDHSIERLSDMPLPRRTLVLRAWKHATGWQ